MVKANDTIFQFYLAMMDFFGEYLSQKYPNNASLEDTKHNQTKDCEDVPFTRIINKRHIR